MAERSKALVLGTSSFESVGSNPTSVSIFVCLRRFQIVFDPKTHVESTFELSSCDGGLAQSEEYVVRNDKAPGSKPGFSMFG